MTLVIYTCAYLAAAASVLHQARGYLSGRRASSPFDLYRYTATEAHLCEQMAERPSSRTRNRNLRRHCNALAVTLDKTRSLDGVRCPVGIIIIMNDAHMYRPIQGLRVLTLLTLASNFLLISTNITVHFGFFVNDYFKQQCDRI